MSIGANILTGFILFPLIIKYLGKEALGVFGVFYSFKSIIDMGMGWFSGSITKNLIRFKYLNSSIFTLSFVINFLYGTVGAVIFYLLMRNFQGEYSLSAVYFALFIFITFGMLPFYEKLISELKQFQVAFFKFLGQFGFMIVSVVLFLSYDDKSLDIIFFSLVLVNTLVFVILFMFYLKNYEFNLEFNHINKKLFNNLFFKDGGRYFMNAVSTILLLQVDVLLIAYLYGNESAGIYLILWKIPNTIIMLGWRLSEPFQAIVASDIKKNRNRVRDDFKRLEKKILLASVFVVILYVIFGNILLSFWLGSENVPNVKYMYIISSLVIIFSVIQRLYLSVNYYTKGLNTTTLLQFIELGFKIVFILFAFDYFQELAPIVGWFFAFLFTIYFYRKNSLKVFTQCKD